MVELQAAAHRLLRRTALVGLILASAGSQPALARHHHAHRGRVLLARAIGHGRPPRLFSVHVRPGSYTPPFAAYAVDGNSGRVLYAQDENAPRHPASITKVMTLYLLFERLEHGQLSLDDRLDVSEHAAAQAPTKLGLRPGSTIRIEDAIKSIVTKSANDMAVAVAEKIGGDEHTFAQMMTRKAHSLGMSRSNFVNASGLPDDMQLTTAHDLAILGRAIHDRYPRYFRFFSTPSFRYAGQFMPNHNHLMEQVDGMDGIKTGYTRSSGFNLLSSVSRDGHWLISVVLGGKTRLGRDRIMADIIAAQIDKCSTTRTAPMIAENPALEHVAEAIPVIQHEGESAPPVENVDEDAVEAKAPPPRERVAAAVEEGAPAVEPASSGDKADEAAGDPPQGREEPDADPVPEPVHRVRQTASRPQAAKPVPVVKVAAEIAQPRPRPAFVSGLPRSGERDMTATGSIHPGRERIAGRFDGTTSHYSGTPTATPSTLRHGAKPEVAAGSSRPANGDAQSGPRGGWVIQIGATPTLAEANALLARAKGQSHGALAAAHPFTEKVQKGRETLFRARFSGLEGDKAETVCRGLKHAGLSCFTSRN